MNMKAYGEVVQSFSPHNVKLNKNESITSSEGLTMLNKNLVCTCYMKRCFVTQASSIESIGNALLTAFAGSAILCVQLIYVSHVRHGAQLYRSNSPHDRLRTVVHKNHRKG